MQDAIIATIPWLSSLGVYNHQRYIGQVVDLALPNPTAKPKRFDFQRMKKIEDQAIKAVPRVYSIHRCRRSPQIASNPAMQRLARGRERPSTRSQTATTATTLATGRVGGSGGDVLNATDAHAGTGKGTEGGLGTGTGGLGAVTTSGTDLDVEGVDAELLAADSDVLSSQHGGVGGGLVTVSLDLHTTGDTADGFATTITKVLARCFFCIS